MSLQDDFSSAYDEEITSKKVDEFRKVYKKDKEASLGGDLAYQATSAANSGLAGLARTVDTIFGDGEDGEFIKRLDANAEYGQEQLSQVQKEANEKTLLSDKDGEIFGEGITDARKISGIAAQGLGSLIPMMVTGGPMAAGAKGLVTKLGANATGKIAAGAGALGYGASEAMMVGGGVSGDIQKGVNDMPQEIMDTVPAYQELISQGASDIDARGIIGREYGVEGMIDSVPLSVLFGTVGGHFMNKALSGRLAGGRLKNAASGVIAEAPTEAGQGASEQYVKNVQLGRINPEITPWDDVAESGLAEGIGGGVVGGGMGVLSSAGKGDNQDNPPIVNEEEAAKELADLNRQTFQDNLGLGEEVRFPTNEGNVVAQGPLVRAANQAQQNDIAPSTSLGVEAGNDLINEWEAPQSKVNNYADINAQNQLGFPEPNYAVRPGETLTGDDKKTFDDYQASNAPIELINKKETRSYKQKPEQLVSELETVKGLVTDPSTLKVLDSEIKLIKKGKNREALSTRLQNPQDKITKRLSPELLDIVNKSIRQKSEQVLGYDELQLIEDNKPVISETTTENNITQTKGDINEQQKEKTEETTAKTEPGEAGSTAKEPVSTNKSDSDAIISADFDQNMQETGLNDQESNFNARLDESKPSQEKTDSADNETSSTNGVRATTQVPNKQSEASDPTTKGEVQATLENVSETMIALGGNRAAKGYQAISKKTLNSGMNSLLANQASEVANKIHTDMTIGVSFEDALASSNVVDGIGTSAFIDALQQIQGHESKPDQEKVQETIDYNKSIGKNPDGFDVYQDERGVRSYVEMGIKISEPVALTPNRGSGISINTDRRGDSYKTTKEINEGKKTDSKKNTNQTGQPASEPEKEQELPDGNEQYRAPGAQQDNEEDKAHSKPENDKKQADGKVVDQFASNVTSEEMQQIDDDIDDVLGEIGQVLLGRMSRKAVQESDADLLPLMSKLMRLAVKKGYLTFEENARFVLDIVRRKFGDKVAEKLDMDDLQGGYIAMKQGTTNKKDVINNYEELRDIPNEVANNSKSSITDSKIQGESNGITKTDGANEVISSEITEPGVSAKEPGQANQKGNKGSSKKPESGPQVVVGTDSVTGQGAKIPTSTGVAGHGANGGSQQNVRDANDADGSVPGTNNASNYVLTDKPNISLTPAKRRDINNLAIEILKKPVNDITEADKEILRQYTGSGGLSLKDSADKGAGIFNQHYTDYTTIKQMYRALDEIGLNSGRALEPSVGSGNFIGMMPSMEWDAVDIDKTNTQVVERLYPQVSVSNESYETFRGKNYDLIISNVPFASFANLPRKHASTVKPAFKSIHNFFFAQSIDKLKTNGIMAFMTSIGTMDGTGEAQNLRDHLVSKMDVIGAFRLPMGTQKANASTDVMIDVIFLQKRPANVESKQQSKNDSFVKVTTKDGHKINKYFVDYPNSVLGELSIGANKTSMGKIGWIVTGEADYSKMKIEKQDYTATKKTDKNKFNGPTEAKKYADDNGLIFKDQVSQPYFEDGIAYDTVVSYDNMSGSGIFGRKAKGVNAEKLAALNEIDKKHDAKLVTKYEEKYGKAPHKDNDLNRWAKAKKADQELKSYLSLFDKNFKLSEIFTDQVRFKDSGKIEVTKDSPLHDRSESLEDADGFLPATNELLSNDEVQDLLDSGDYARVGSNKLQNARLYYAGNIYEKLDNLSKVTPAAQRNKQKQILESVKPKPFTFKRLSITGGESWLPDAAVTAIGKETNYDGKVVIGGKAIENYNDLTLFNSHINREPLVTRGKDETDEELATKIKEARNHLNDFVLPLIKQKLTDDGLENSVVEAYNRKKNFFADPVFDGSSLKDLPKTFRGKPFKLMQHQLRGAERAIYNKKGVIAFSPGLGKTPTAVVVANQLMAKGVMKKPLFIVPANTVAQWEETARELYPDAKIFEFPKYTRGINIGVAKEWKDLTATEKETMIYDLTNNRYDYTFIGDMLAQKFALPARKHAQYVEELAESISRMEKDDGELSKSQIKAKEKRLAHIEMFKETMRVANEETRTLGFTMEKLGFDAIFADEVQNYKNIGMQSADAKGGIGANVGLKVKYPKDDNGKEIKTSDPISVSLQSARSYDFRFKTKYISEANSGNNIFLLTGTPTPNKPLELMTLLHHLDTHILDEYGITDVGGFVDEFLEISEVEQVGLSGKLEMRPQLSRIKNIDALKNIISRYVDYISPENAPDLIRPEEVEVLHTLLKSETAERVFEDIMSRLEAAIEDAQKIRSGEIDPDEAERIIVMYGAGRAASIDLRLYKPSDKGGLFDSESTFEQDNDPKTSKIALTVDLVSEQYKKDNDSGQLIFIDPLTFKNNGGSTHENIRSRILEKTGLNPEQVVFANGSSYSDPRTGKIAKSGPDSKKLQQIMKAYNAGDIKILIGNTAKLGVGVDLQVTTTDVYQIDIPYRPDQIEQRTNRAVRQGNRNKQVRVHKFITPGTFDEMSLRLIANKQGFNDVYWKDQTSDKAEVSAANTPDAYAQAIELQQDPDKKRKLEIERDLSKSAHKTNAIEKVISSTAKRIRTADQNRLQLENSIKNIDTRENPEYKDATPAERKKKIAAFKKRMKEQRAENVLRLAEINGDLKELHSNVGLRRVELQEHKEYISSIRSEFVINGVVSLDAIKNSNNYTIDSTDDVAGFIKGLGINDNTKDGDNGTDEIAGKVRTLGDNDIDGQVRLLESKNKNKVTGSTVKEIESLVPKRVKLLLDSGNLEIVQSVNDISDKAYSFSADEDIEGFYDPDTDTLYLVADQLNTDNFNSVLQHELYHRARATDKVLQKQLSRLDKVLQVRFDLVANGKGTAAEKAAYNRVMDSNTPVENQLEELAAYMVTAYNKNPQSLSESMRRWVRDLIASIRGALMRQGLLPKNITPADLNALAKYGTRSLKRSSASTKGANKKASTDTYERFYSQLKRGIQRSPDRLFNKPGKVIAQWLESNAPKLGIKADEIYWSGITDWLNLQEGKVTKGDITSYLDNNGITVEDVVLGKDFSAWTFDKESDAGISEEGGGVWIASHKVETYAGHEYINEEFVTKEDALEYLEDEGLATYSDNGSKLDEYIEENNGYVEENDGSFDVYWEDEESVFNGYSTLAEAEGELRIMAAELLESSDFSPQGYAKHNTKDLALSGGRDYQELVITIPTIEEFNQDDFAHFGDAGEGKQIAWIRHNTRTDSNGNETLFLEEVQSQRGQEGRKKGFAVPNDKEVKIAYDNYLNVLSEIEKITGETFTEKEPFNGGTRRKLAKKAGLRNDYLELKEEYHRVKGINFNSVPPAPFVTDSNNKATNAYITLMLKKAISQAIDKGQASVSWTTGDQQADRYDLSKKVSKVDYVSFDKENKTGHLTIYGTSGNVILEKSNVSENELQDYIGKEPAEKLLNSSTDKKRSIQGGDLKIGGAWTKAMYGDEQGLNANGKPALITQAARDIAKKMGGKVGTVNVEIDAGEPTAHADFDAYVKAKENTNKTQPAIIITDKMRAKVLGEGMPLFSVAPGNVLSDIFKSWFGKSKMKSGGKPIKFYHGTNDDFNIFDNKKLQGSTGHTTAGLGHFFTANKGEAQGYGGKLKEVYLSFQNPYVTTSELLDKKMGDDAQVFVDKLKKQGYDSIYIKDAKYAIAFDSNQAKLTSNKLPTSSPDVRYSKAENTTTEDFKRKAGLGKKKTLADTIKQILTRGIAANKQAIKDYWNDIKAPLEQGIFDKHLGIKLAEKEIMGNVLHSVSGYIGARLSTGSSSTMTAVMQHGAPIWKNGIIEKKEGTKGFAEILMPVKDDIENYTAWMVAVRADRLYEEGKENNFTRSEIDAGLALEQDSYQGVADNIAEMNNAILDLSEDAGIINPESRALFENSDYIPFYRMVEGNTFGSGSKRGLSHQASGIKMLKGGENPLSDPLGNLMQNWAHLIDASMKNSALDKTIINLDGSRFIESRPKTDFKQVIIPKSQIKELMKESGLPDEVIDSMPADLTNGIAKMFSMVPPSDPDVVRVMRDGKPEYFKVNDAMLLSSLTSLNQEQLQGLFKPMRYMKRLLTSTVTATPAFMARNFIRDSMHSWTIAEEKGFKLGVSSIHGAVKSFKEEGGYVDMMFAGASFQGGYGNYNNPGAAREAMDSALRAKGITNVEGFVNSVIDTPRKYWEMYRAVGDAIENANREAILEISKKSGNEKAQYVFEAKDIMDFSMGGSFTIIRAMSDVLPFFSARLTGIYRLAQAGKTKEATAMIAAKGAAIAMASLALLAINSDNDDYEGLEDWDKDTYWHIFAGDQHFRIPKPFELGLIFGTIPERSARLLVGKDSLKEFSKRMGHGATDTLAFNPVPQMFKPFVEVYSNRNMFTTRPIEGMADEGKIASARYNEYTSDIMRALSASLPEELGASPKRLEHLMRGYLGSLGMYVLGSADMVVRAMTDAPNKPAMRMDRMPLIRAFYQEKPAMHTKYGTQFYDMLSDVNSINRTINAYRKEGRLEAANELQSKSIKKLQTRRQLLITSKSLSKIRKRISSIMRSDIPSSEKRVMIDELMKLSNDRVRRVVKRTHPYFS